MFGSGVFARNAGAARRARRSGALAAAGLAACAVLAACSPVKMGAAAIVGDQRITVSSLGSRVSDLQEAAKPYGAKVSLAAAQMPTVVLSWLIRFAIMDQLAADHGISVTQAQVQRGVTIVNSEAKSLASQQGIGSPQAILLNAGISPQMMTAIGRYQAQEIAYAEKVNNGRLPTTQAEDSAVTAKFARAECLAAKALNIQVSPQFGRVDYTQYAIVPAADVLSRPEGAPSPAATAGLAPAC